MCSHYHAAKARAILERLGLSLPPDWEPPPSGAHIYPGLSAPIVWRPQSVGGGAAADAESVYGMFGLLPFWARDRKLARNCYNARSETAATKPSFRDAWKRGQHCIIPAQAIYEPDWRSGNAVATRIEMANGAPMGLAGLWDRWMSPDGETVLSFAMLTINADDHALMRHFHKPGEEKRMVAVLADDAFADWLDAPADRSLALLRPCPADRLQVSAHPGFEGRAASATRKTKSPPVENLQASGAQRDMWESGVVGPE